MHRYRISITLSPAMTVALEIHAERTGLPVATQATVILRQALDRTIHSQECIDRLAKRQAFGTNRQWHEDVAADAEVDRAMRRAEPIQDAGEQ